MQPDSALRANILDMDKILTGKRAIVTGGTKGIGRAVAETLLGAGAAVAICGRRQESVDQTVEELRGPTGGNIIGTAADVRSETDVRGLFEFVDRELGGSDILINNAGLGIFRPVADLSVEEWKQVIDTNLTGVFLCSREALRRYRGASESFIVNISSLAGKNPFVGGAAYNASKFGLNGFSEAMMLDHRQEDVRVCYVMPGSVDTEFRPGSPGRDSGWKIAAEDVAEIVLTVLCMPKRTLISRVEVRPSKPPAK